ncbi:hypothetical protein [Sphingomonas hengshuiensis]|uniref:hypothetical protein n=1 Tax=Sphingomonas hengshuiensis TaxID=1609977 RepID=UPI0012B8273E|nr:hypothetical protein [Sphingomonas hengshuiensis]
MALVQLFGQFAGHAVDRAPALDKQIVPDLREFVGAIAQAWRSCSTRSIAHCGMN